MQPTVAVIGAGAMGEAIIRGLLRAGWQPGDVTAADTDSQKLTVLDELGVLVTTDAGAAAAGREVIVVVVKPDHVVEVVDRLASAIDNAQVVLSVAAGVPTSTY